VTSSKRLDLTLPGFYIQLVHKVAVNVCTAPDTLTDFDFIAAPSVSTPIYLFVIALF